MYEIYLSNFHLHMVIRPVKGNRENIIATSYKGLFYMGKLRYRRVKGFLQDH